MTTSTASAGPTWTMPVPSSRPFPGEDKIAGFYMGPDGYHWGRDFLTKNPDGPRQTVMQKQWLSFALWGRLAYEPDLPAATFERAHRRAFPRCRCARTHRRVGGCLEDLSLHHAFLLGRH